MDRVVTMLKPLKRFLVSRGPSDVLTMILGPSFIVYGAGILEGYREQLVSILGLPSWVYGGIFIVAGVLKLIGLILHWGRASHTIGVTVSTFWASVILTFAPTVTGWVGALPWIAIGLIALAATLWPTPPVAAIVVTPRVLDMKNETDPTMRAIDYLNQREERINDNADPSER